MQIIRKYVLLLICVFTSLSLCAVSVPAEDESDIVDEHYSFSVKIGDVDAGYMISIEGIGLDVSIIESPIENSLLTKLKPDRIEPGRITLKKRFLDDSPLNDWIKSVLQGNIEQYRKNMTITLIGHDGGSESSRVVQRWRFYRCFPSSWEMSPFIAGSNNELTEEIVVACEWFEEDSKL